jgi:hypothetical protein
VEAMAHAKVATEVRSGNTVPLVAAALLPAPMLRVEVTGTMLLPGSALLRFLRLALFTRALHLHMLAMGWLIVAALLSLPLRLLRMLLCFRVLLLLRTLLWGMLRLCWVLRFRALLFLRPGRLRLHRRFVLLVTLCVAKAHGPEQCQRQ